PIQVDEANGDPARRRDFYSPHLVPSEMRAAESTGTIAPLVPADSRDASQTTADTTDSVLAAMRFSRPSWPLGRTRPGATTFAVTPVSASSTASVRKRATLAPFPTL